MPPGVVRVAPNCPPECAVLPAARRVRRAPEFATAIRGGVRVGRRTMVVHLAQQGDRPARAGFVVSKAVGNSVVRHRVVRRLRHVVAPLLDELPVGTQVVVRALPAAAQAESASLRSELAGALQAAERKWQRRATAE